MSLEARKRFQGHNDPEGNFLQMIYVNEIGFCMRLEVRTTAQGPRDPARTVFEVSLHTRNFILHVRGRADKGLGTQVPRRNRFGSAFTYAEFEFACPWACGQEPMDPGAQAEVFLKLFCIQGIPFAHVHGRAQQGSGTQGPRRKCVSNDLT